MSFYFPSLLFIPKEALKLLGPHAEVSIINPVCVGKEHGSFLLILLIVKLQ